MTSLPDNTDLTSQNTLPLSLTPLGQTMGLIQSKSPRDSESAQIAQIVHPEMTSGSQDIPQQPFDPVVTPATTAPATGVTVTDPLGPVQDSAPQLPATTSTTTTVKQTRKTPAEEPSRTPPASPAPGPTHLDEEQSARPEQADSGEPDIDVPRKRKRVGKKKKEAVSTTPPATPALGPANPDGEPSTDKQPANAPGRKRKRTGKKKQDTTPVEVIASGGEAGEEPEEMPVRLQRLSGK